MRFNGRKQIMSASLILNMFPGPLLMIAIYFILKMLGLTNSHFGMIIVYSAGSGLGFLIMKGFMDTIPNDKYWTVSLLLYNMLEKSLVNKYFSVFCAGGIVVAIPISILFVIMQKYYVEGVTGGSVKG